MKTSINLTTSENSLQGLFMPNSDCLVMCDATNGDMEVLMPDSQSTDTTTFRFVKKDNSLHFITLKARPGQRIMNETEQVLTLQADELVLNSDGENWW